MRKRKLPDQVKKEKGSKIPSLFSCLIDPQDTWLSGTRCLPFFQARSVSGTHSIREVADPLTQPKKSGPRFIPELIVYMEEHLEEPLSLDDMAERFHRTKEHICYAFKEETGITYVDFLTRVRLFKARNLLLDHPEMKLDEVARQCGFSSASYFGLLFKRDVGMTPGMFRLAERRS